ncbi:hypothetical protein FD754_019827 [Muntiacus muntjak]|uniref:Fork-head domain-containing protein n=1 Tax=Muntiacus muntjak TaxID=9888 RepID=A0A5N3V369_MUNMU|nr:hypothetical protein FD754_019827 [Muntiacus muntjak]
MGPVMPPSKKPESSGISVSSGLSPCYRGSGFSKALQEDDDLDFALPDIRLEEGAMEDEELTNLNWLHESKNLLKSFGDSVLRSVSPVQDPDDEPPPSPAHSDVPYDARQNPNCKPPYSFSCLIFMAIEDSPTKRLPVKDIYNWILEHFPYFANAPTGWKNSVRHNLSLNKCFKKVDKERSQGRGTWWAAASSLPPAPPGKPKKRHKRCRCGPWVGMTPGRRARQTTPVFSPGESHGQRSLAGYGREDSAVRPARVAHPCCRDVRLYFGVMCRLLVWCETILRVTARLAWRVCSHAGPRESNLANAHSEMLNKTSSTASGGTRELSFISLGPDKRVSDGSARHPPGTPTLLWEPGLPGVMAVMAHAAPVERERVRGLGGG